MNSDTRIMKNFVLLLTILYTKFCWANCLKNPLERIKQLNPKSEVFSEKNLNHYIFYAKESCGTKGCEIFVFTKILPTCWDETLNTKGYYFKGNLKFNSLIIKQDRQNVEYQYKENKWLLK